MVVTNMAEIRIALIFEAESLIDHNRKQRLDPRDKVSPNRIGTVTARDAVSHNVHLCKSTCRRKSAL